MNKKVLAAMVSIAIFVTGCAWETVNEEDVRTGIVEYIHYSNEREALVVDVDVAGKQYVIELVDIGVAPTPETLFYVMKVGDEVSFPVLYRTGTDELNGRVVYTCFEEVADYVPCRIPSSLFSHTTKTSG